MGRAELQPMAEFAHNNSRHVSMQMSPFEAMQGYTPRMSFEEPANFKARSKSAKEHAEQLAELLKVLKTNLAFRSRTADQVQGCENKDKVLQVDSHVNN